MRTKNNQKVIVTPSHFINTECFYMFVFLAIELATEISYLYLPNNCIVYINANLKFVEFLHQHNFAKYLQEQLNNHFNRNDFYIVNHEPDYDKNGTSIGFHIKMLKGNEIKQAAEITFDLGRFIERNNAFDEDEEDYLDSDDFESEDEEDCLDTSDYEIEEDEAEEEYQYYETKSYRVFSYEEMVAKMLEIRFNQE
ncbi:hypothetical protein [Brevibacillus sp. AY1]|uniref:hypothetical protein n=1 Tax=Brevibacillus sp. AY1 TaxID=2807621 RepID=UPI002455B56E|nr:hypothetical protein [Brevibacillus sp. AY1]MDH4617635.1 hypothetical protein [Brevibacillus sp. AY1]